MGFYINPPGEPKEAWLHRVGERIPNPVWPPEPGKTLVCLVSNTVFTAAGIAFDTRELERFTRELEYFTDPSDRRIRTWFLVPTHLIPEVSNIPIQLLVPGLEDVG